MMMTHARPAAPDDMTETEIALGAGAVALDPVGAVWLPEPRALLVADLHLEKATSRARAGMFLPPHDSAATLMRLEHVVERRNPALVVCLGDSFHDREGAARLGAAERARLGALQRRRSWIWIAGNHDPEIGEGVGGERCARLDLDGLVLVHEPSGAPGEIAGHLHPCAKIWLSGRTIRRRAFVMDGSRLVVPAFGALTGGLNVLDRAYRSVLDPGFSTYLVGEARLYRVARGALRPD